MLCPRCRAELPDDANFCIKCGKRVNSSMPSAQKHRRRAKGTGTVYKLQGRRSKPWAACVNGRLIGTCRTSGEAAAPPNQYNASRAPEALRRVTFFDGYAPLSGQHS